MSKEIFVAIRNVSGTGTRLDPFNASTPSALDAILSDPQYENTTIHFGPGVFRTTGFGGFGSNAIAQSGQRLIGSGMFATILQLVDATPVAGAPSHRRRSFSGFRNLRHDAGCKPEQAAEAE